MTFAGSGTGGACSDTWQNVAPVGSEQVGGVTYGVYPAPFASNAAVGQPTASASGDPGTITVCVQATNAGITRHETSAAMTNTNFTTPTRAAPMMDVKTGFELGERRMLTRTISARVRRVRQEHGFTLVELLVTMVAGIVVLSALYTILDVTLRQTTNTFTRLDSTGRGNAVLAGIENELHSACVASGETPVQGGANGTQASDANDLVFLSQYGTSANPTPVEHKITYTATTGKLTDYSYTSTGGQAPELDVRLDAVEQQAAAHERHSERVHSGLPVLRV